MPRAPGIESFGPYELVRSLGRGGMAETFVAEKKLLGGATLLVCLKRILPGLLGDPELVRSFEREARIAATLRHANVAGLVDYGEVEGRHYLAFDLIEGVDLRVLLKDAHARGGPLPVELVSEILFGLLHALEFSHAFGRDDVALGVIHRDLSPSNVLLGRQGEVKLADFGIAKFAGESHQTRSGLLRGKIPYMPPEYVRGGEFTASGDLFALGVIAFECLAHVRPYDGANDAETLDRLVHGRRRDLRELRPDLPDSLVDTVHALLEADPTVRPARARDVLGLLDDHAPRATTRLRLAERVAALAPAEFVRATLPYQETIVAVFGEPPEVIPASPDDVTRTRAPR